MIASGWNETERVARGRRAMTRSGMARPLQRRIRRTVFRGPTGYARSALSANGITTEKAFGQRNGDCIRDGARAGSRGVRVLRPNGAIHTPLSRQVSRALYAPRTWPLVAFPSTRTRQQV